MRDDAEMVRHVRSADAEARPRTLLRASRLRAIIYAAAGAAIGAGYAHVVGCRTGTCPLTSSVWTAALYGAVVGGIAGWPARGR